MTETASLRIVVAVALFSGLSVPVITAGFVGAMVSPVVADRTWVAPPADPVPAGHDAVSLAVLTVASKTRA